MVFGSLRDGGRAVADAEDGEIVLRFHDTNAPAGEA